MFLDDVVISGLIVVGGTLAFLLGIGVFVYQDAHKKKPDSDALK
ncbi:cytochrome c oxidase subunit CcoM [Ketobacter sp.]|nr:cytochrome c oxidase subunit CcoM [Ketobacter sp.]MEE2732380.1 cytochrome c oxidase subunit CcoM [Pseudomonadota bacterium]